MRRFVLFSLYLALLACPSLIAQSTAAAAARPAPVLEGLPALTWQNPPLDWKIDAGHSLSITAGKQTDWYIPAMDGEPHNNTPRLLFKPGEDFVLTAKVDVGIQSQWDSGALVLYIDDKHWAKLCLEQTIYKHPAIVTVVTRDLSDDSNSMDVKGNSAYLKIVKSGKAIFFSASEDGEHWMLVRIFSLGEHPDLRVGFSSQAPTGDSCTSVFTKIRYRAGKFDWWKEN